MSYKAPTIKTGKAGRPAPDVNPAQVKELAEINCTLREIAAVCGCSVDFLEDHFKEIIDQGREVGKQSIRRLQYLKAKDGSVPMLIWLGKQLLGQTEKFVHAEDNSISSDPRSPEEVMKDVDKLQKRLSMVRC